MGIHTIAVHTELDRSAPHVYAADQAVAIDSYLDIEAVIEAARATGAEAIHPGYGFLSERAAFAQRRRGRRAHPGRTERRGDGADGPQGRTPARSPSLPACPSSRRTSWTPTRPASTSPCWSRPPPVVAARACGSSAARASTPTPLAAARREAGSAFGDDTMLIEKYVESGRHIEVQVLADRHGHVVHLFERDCSTQRRHQKVLEEAPAPTISAAQREEVTSAAVALARQVGLRERGHGRVPARQRDRRRSTSWR